MRMDKYQLCVILRVRLVKWDHGVGLKEVLEHRWHLLASNYFEEWVLHVLCTIELVVDHDLY
jgi:hypothetical protein